MDRRRHRGPASASRGKRQLGRSVRVGVRRGLVRGREALRKRLLNFVRENGTELGLQAKEEESKDVAAGLRSAVEVIG